MSASSIQKEIEFAAYNVQPSELTRLSPYGKGKQTGDRPFKRITHAIVVKPPKSRQNKNPATQQAGSGTLPGPAC